MNRSDIEDIDITGSAPTAEDIHNAEGILTCKYKLHPYIVFAAIIFMVVAYSDNHCYDYRISLVTLLVSGSRQLA